MAATDNRTTASLYVRPDDRARFDKLAALETRKPVDQFTVLIDEACRSRGLDPETVEPVKSPASPASVPSGDDAADDVAA